MFLVRKASDKDCESDTAATVSFLFAFFSCPATFTYTVAGVDDKVIKKIVGHKGQSVTEVVYTHFEIEELRDAINRI